MQLRLYHVSEEANIDAFVPRVHATWPDLGPHVWAIEEALLMNYLLPRECPRVTYYAVDTTSQSDIDAHLGGNPKAHHVVIEAVWLKRVQDARLCLYQLPHPPFQVFDRGAGYWISNEICKPIDRIMITSATKEIVARGSELTSLQSLWPLFDEIAASSLQFSMIRMRNAQPRGDIHEQ